MSTRLCHEPQGANHTIIEGKVNNMTLLDTTGSPACGVVHIIYKRSFQAPAITTQSQNYLREISVILFLKTVQKILKSD